MYNAITLQKQIGNLEKYNSEYCIDKTSIRSKFLRLATVSVKK